MSALEPADILDLVRGKDQQAARALATLEAALLQVERALSSVDEVARRCTEVESGARNVDNILSNSLLPDISRQLLGHMAEGEKLSAIHVSIGDNGEFVYN